MISERLENTTVTISIHGAFDSETSHDFSFTAQRAYRMGFRDFFFNLKALTSINKAGLIQIFTTKDNLQQKGCTGTIIDPPSFFGTELDVREGNLAPFSFHRLSSHAVAQQ